MSCKHAARARLFLQREIRIMSNTPKDGNQLRVYRYFEKVPDFRRDSETNNTDVTSLRGYMRTEAREQFVREKVVAMEEVKLIREELRQCYIKEGVNHLESCKPLVDKYFKLLSSPHYGMENVSLPVQL